MIELKDVIQLWLATNKNLSRSWQLAKDPGDMWVLSPKIPKHYKINSRAVLLSDCIKMHCDDDDVIMDKGCHTVTIMAYESDFFQKLAQWMHLVRRR